MHAKWTVKLAQNDIKKGNKREEEGKISNFEKKNNEKRKCLDNRLRLGKASLGNISQTIWPEQIGVNNFQFHRQNVVLFRRLPTQTASTK